MDSPIRPETRRGHRAASSSGSGSNEPTSPTPSTASTSLSTNMNKIIERVSQLDGPSAEQDSTIAVKDDVSSALREGSSDPALSPDLEMPPPRRPCLAAGLPNKWGDTDNISNFELSETLDDTLSRIESDTDDQRLQRTRNWAGQQRMMDYLLRKSSCARTNAEYGQVWITKLEQRISFLTSTNEDLYKLVTRLRDDNRRLHDLLAKSRRQQVSGKI